MEAEQGRRAWTLRLRGSAALAGVGEVSAGWLHACARIAGTPNPAPARRYCDCPRCRNADCPVGEPSSTKAVAKDTKV